MLMHVVAWVAVVLMLADAPDTGPLAYGKAAYERGDYAEALKSYQFAADLGDVLPKYCGGMTYGIAL